MGAEFDGSIQVGQRLIVRSQFRVGLSTGADGPRVAGIEFDGAVQVGQGIGITFRPQIVLPAGADGIGVSGVEFDGAVEVDQIKRQAPLVIIIWETYLFPLLDYLSLVASESAKPASPDAIP